MERLRRQLRFDQCEVVESMNKAGGMMVLWNDEVIVMDIKTTAFTIEFQIKDT